MGTSSSIFSLMTLPETSMRLCFRSSRFPLVATLDLWKFTRHTNNSLPELSSPARIDLEGRLCWCWQPGVYAKDWQVYGELVLMSKESWSIHYLTKQSLVNLSISKVIFYVQVEDPFQCDKFYECGTDGKLTPRLCEVRYKMFLYLRLIYTFAIAGRPCVWYSRQILQPPSKVRESFLSNSLAIGKW